MSPEFAELLRAQRREWLRLDCDLLSRAVPINPDSDRARELARVRRAVAARLDEFDRVLA